MARKKKTESEVKTDYYSLKNILSKNAQYNVIFGERSNGKTYAVLELCLKNYFRDRSKFAILRRRSADVTASKIRTFFSAFWAGDVNLVEKWSGGTWDRITSRSGYFYLARYDVDLNKIVTDSDYIGVAISISESEHFKSTSFPEITTVFFDEFITRLGYLPDEFILFMNVLSTIIRDRKNVKIFMCGNTVNKFNPYFAEMGLYNAQKMEQGTIDVYSYGKSNLTVAVEYCGNVKKESNVYFAFNNPKINMITTGSWELDIYPHIPRKYDRSDVLLTFYIEFKEHILAGDIIQSDNDIFIFIHRKTSPIRDRENEIIYSLVRDSCPLHFHGISATDSRKINKRIIRLITDRKLFFQDNEIGDVFFNFLNESKNISI